ncbi:MAG: hypothetical protein PHG98_07180 [Bacteroidales bacterium]|nr:hypothetical protein [Bacteroidales bacterium]
MEYLNYDANNASKSIDSKENKSTLKETYFQKKLRQAKERQEETSKMQFRTFYLYNEDMGGYYETEIDESPYFINELKFKYLDRTLDQVNQLLDYVEKERKAIEEYNVVFEKRMDLKKKISDLSKKIETIKYYCNIL